MSLTRLLPFLIPATLLAGGCPGCGNDPVDEEDAGSSGNVGRPDGSTGGNEDGGTLPKDGGTADAAVAPDTLTYVGTPPVALFHGAGVDLTFALQDPQNQAIIGRAVNFAITGTGATLSTSASATNAMGRVTVRLTAGNTDADLVVRASTSNAADATVAVNIRSIPAGNLVVSVQPQSPARIVVTRAEISVYVGPAASVQTCTALSALAALPTATAAQTLNAVPGMHTFNMLTANQSATVFANGYNAAGDRVATGCTEGALIQGGMTNSVTVTLNQLPSVLTGTYDVLMAMDVGNAVPQPYEDYVDYVTLIASDPAGAVVYYIMQIADQQVGTSFVRFPNSMPPRNATLTEVLGAANMGIYNTWQTARNFVHGQLSGNMGTVGTIYNRFVTIGADLRNAVTNFELGSSFQLQSVAGMPASYQVTETWQSIGLVWNTGCATGDLACARRLISLQGSGYSPVVKVYNATSVHAPTTGAAGTTERYQVNADAHPFAFSYGTAILAILEQAVFPSVCTGCSSLPDVLANVVDCAAVGTWVASNSAGLLTAMQGEMFCGTGLNLVGTLAVDYVTGLTVGGQNPELGTKDQPGLGGGGVFYLVDGDRDLKTELVRDLSMSVRWSDPMDPQFTQDVTAPITGKGRTQATNCLGDAFCTTAPQTVCKPIAHYMEVARLEYTCARPVGATAGGASCTMDNQCQSGDCLGINGTNPGTCYRACAANAQCGSGGTCNAMRTTVDLDSTRNGLGDVAARGCD
jgi:hypothetical protein